MSLFINIYDYQNTDYPFQIFIGGRGTGKTYSALKGALTGECKGKFLFMRRTRGELDLMLDSPARGEGANPFKVLNRDLGLNVGLTKIVDNLAGIYDREEKNGSYVYADEPRGYGVALSTINSIRGVDFSDVTDWIYDEFIPEKHVKRMRSEADALLNAYETVCRNRELSGAAPVRLWLLANSNDIYNPIFEGLNIVSEVEKMIRSGKHDRYLPARGLAIHVIDSSGEFIEKKSQTALYKLTQGSAFSGMALNNDFSYNDFSLIASRSVHRGYIPLCSFGPSTIYKKKGAREVYVSYTPAKAPHYNSDVAQDRRAFYRDIGYTLAEAYTRSCIVFESYELKELILNAIL